MKLIQIYECLCDETRLRILNLLQITPMCVSHLQKILEMPQVKVTKHMAYMKDRGMVEATRHENRMLYALCKSASGELESNLKCLQDCSKDYAVFAADVKRLANMSQEIAEIIQKAQVKVKK